MSKPNFIYYLFKRDETVFELNQFADLTSAEFKQKILMKSRPAPKHEAKKFIKIIS